MNINKYARANTNGLSEPLVKINIGNPPSGQVRKNNFTIYI